MNFRLCPSQRSPSIPEGQTCYTGDNGTDPILGPPYPPVNYMLTIDPQRPPRLMWNAPDVIIDVEIVSQEAFFITFQIFILNFTWPAYAGGTTYITNSKTTYNGVRYYSLQDNNTGNQPDISPSFWAVDQTGFELYLFVNTAYVKIGDSDGGTAATWNWSDLSFTLVQGGLVTGAFTFYAASTLPSGQTVTSQEFQIIAE